MKLIECVLICDWDYYIDIPVPMPKEVVEWYFCPRRHTTIYRCTEVPKTTTRMALAGVGNFEEINSDLTKELYDYQKKSEGNNEI